jgi:tetratricopeptide (TPR) repeat protein
LKPEFKDAVFNEAAAYIKLRQFSEAIDSLEKYNQLELNDHESFFLRGYLLKEVSKYDEALECFAKSVHLKPTFYEG